MQTKTMWSHIRRSPYQALAAILIMVLTFLAVSVFTILVVGSSGVISYFESKPEVTAFFKNDAKQANINALQSALKTTGAVASMKFISKDEALKIYQQQNKNDPLLLELVTADVLPASLEVSAVNLDQLPQLSSYLQKDPTVQEVVYQKDVVSALTTWTNAIRIIGVLLVAMLSVVSVLIMSIIIGMKISHKKDEIEIMQLIGATKWYISNPFILEGVFYGLVGAFFGWAVSSAILLATTPLLETFLRGIPVVPAPWWFYVSLLAGELLFAVVLGMVSSVLAVMRYIK